MAVSCYNTLILLPDMSMIQIVAFLRIIWKLKFYIAIYLYL